MSIAAKKKVKQEERSKEEIFQEINRHLEDPLLLPTCLERALIRLIPTGSDSNRLQRHNIKLDKLHKFEALQIQQFVKKVDILDSSIMILRNIETKKYKFIQPKETSRYFDSGRRRIKNRIMKKIGKKNIQNGIMITLTYDPVKVRRNDAWADVGRHISMFMDWSNMHRKRRMGAKKRLNYFWVIEEQEGTGYPHVHIFYPGLKFYAAFYDIKKAWKKYGSIDLKSYRGVNIARYITKYIGKLKGFSLLALSYLWANRRRIYSFSKSLQENTGPGAVKEKRYELWGIFNGKKGYGEYSETEKKFIWHGLMPVHEVLELEYGVEKGDEGVFELFAERMIRR